MPTTSSPEVDASARTVALTGAHLAGFTPMQQAMAQDLVQDLDVVLQAGYLTRGLAAEVLRRLAVLLTDDAGDSHYRKSAGR